MNTAAEMHRDTAADECGTRRRRRRHRVGDAGRKGASATAGGGERRDPPTDHRRLAGARATASSRTSSPRTWVSAATRCAKRSRRSPARVSSRSSPDAAPASWCSPTTGRPSCSRCASRSRASSPRLAAARRTDAATARPHGHRRGRARRARHRRPHGAAGPNTRFHRLLVEAANNALLAEMLNELMHVIEWMYTQRVARAGALVVGRARSDHRRASPIAMPPAPRRSPAITSARRATGTSRRGPRPDPVSEAADRAAVDAQRRCR